MPVHHDLDQRWLLLVTPDTVVVPVGDRRGDAITALRALPAGTVVALVGGRRLGWLAWRGRLHVDKRYVALPSMATPVAITQITAGSLGWMTRTVLTVPSGITRQHALVWAAVRLVRAMPRLLSRAPAGDRILVGTRS